MGRDRRYQRVSPLMPHRSIDKAGRTEPAPAPAAAPDLDQQNIAEFGVGSKDRASDKGSLPRGPYAGRQPVPAPRNPAGVQWPPACRSGDRKPDREKERRCPELPWQVPAAVPGERLASAWFSSQNSRKSGMRVSASPTKTKSRKGARGSGFMKTAIPPAATKG